MKMNLIRKLQAAGFAELWRDPVNGQLYTREHAANVMHSRQNQKPVEDSAKHAPQTDKAKLRRKVKDEIDAACDLLSPMRVIDWLREQLIDARVGEVEHSPRNQSLKSGCGESEHSDSASERNADKSKGTGLAANGAVVPETDYPPSRLQHLAPGQGSDYEQHNPTCDDSDFRNRNVCYRGDITQEIMVEHSPRSPEEAGNEDLFVIKICRELYDRFVMGGWEPWEAAPLVREYLAELRSSSPHQVERDK